MELSFEITTITPMNFARTATVAKKRFTPLINGEKLSHIYIRDVAEVEATAKTAIKTDLTSKGYSWTTEI